MEHEDELIDYRKYIDIIKRDNLCGKIPMPSTKEVETPSRVFMCKHFGGVKYRKVLELVKQHYPENFI